MSNNPQQQLHDIVNPHEHDVLSGRGNFVNYHAGNEHFRMLVRKHKVAYVACPKPQKGKFSRLIVDEIKARNPPGRFLKQDPETKLWHDIGEKKALDKTRQALREGAPEISKELSGDGGDDGINNTMQNPVLKGPGGAGMFGLDDPYGTPDLQSELDQTLAASQQAALSNMMQQSRMQQQQQQQISRQMMTGNLGGRHPGQLYAGQVQKMQQQQQLLLQKQQQNRLQQQNLNRQMGGGGMGQMGGGMGQMNQMGMGMGQLNQIGGMGGMGGMGGNNMNGGGGGLGGMGVNPYANFQNSNDYDDLDSSPLNAGSMSMNARFNNQMGQMPSNQAQLQAQLQAQAQLQVQKQQMQQMQRQQMQQEQPMQNPSLSAHLNKNSNFEVQSGVLKDDSGDRGGGSFKKRPVYERESSDQSLNLKNAFEDTIEHGVLESGATTDKAKQKLGGSSNHMSIMSLTLSEVGDEGGNGVAGDLSAMFDSSLQISDKRASGATARSSLEGRRKSDDTSKAALLDMSVATIGNDLSTVGGMSSALGDVGEDSAAHMSFSNMFDDSERTNL